MRFHLLGPVEAVVAERNVVPPGRGRLVLAALLLRANSTVSRNELVDALWESDLPANPDAALQTTVSRLRTALDTCRDQITTEPHGYRITIDPAQLDLLQFRTTVEEALQEQDTSARIGLLRKALAQWRGEPLSGLPPSALVRDNAPALTEERLRAIELLAADQLELEQHAEIVPQLTSLARRYPARERLAVLLMQAQFRSGQQAEALHVYHRIRTYLADELGVDPGPELRSLYDEVLNSGGPRTVRRRREHHRPRQLPTDITRFTGRTADLAVLDTLIPDTADPPVVIVALDGPGGVGKTALAVHWAHSVKHQFPDGQLYLDLRGHGPGRPLESSMAIETVLRSLGITDQQIPTDLDSRSALLRTVLAGKRMLLLLDNAADASQIRPLLPGSGSLVLITSRTQLRGLVVREGAHRLTLDQLPNSEAAELLTRIIGDRARLAPAAIDDLVRRCNGLPLALVIAAERATRSPDARLADLVAELSGERDQLDFLGSGDDPSTDIRSVFSWSYHALSPGAARLLRLLAIFPGADIGVPAAAALAGLSQGQTVRLLDQLVDSSQLMNRRPGRYELHDLMRTYAAELAEQLDPPELRSAALRRLVDNYLQTAVAARPWLQAGEPAISFPAGLREPEPIEDARSALAWHETEGRNLVVVAKLALEHGFDDLCWRFAYAAWVGPHRGNNWQDLLEIQQAGLHAAERAGDLIGQAHGHSGIGGAHRGAGRQKEAIAEQLKALELFQHIGDPSGQAATLRNLSAVHLDAGRLTEALSYGSSAQVTDQATGRPGNTAKSAYQVALTLLALGKYDESVVVGAQACELFREVGQRRAEAGALHLLATARGRLGEHESAIEAARAAVEIRATMGDHAFQAIALEQLGDLLLATGRRAEADRAWLEALGILDDLGDPAADVLRSRLSDLTVGGNLWPTPGPLRLH
jgi:DNA-binding SARP family transcriptional activator/tetratricopeptide (TPR) repeat protein